MAACKRQRVDKCMPEALASPPEIEWTLPADLLLEIVARSDILTLVLSAATSKLLRDDIFDPRFIHRVTREGGIVPGCMVALLNAHDDKADPPPPLSLVHPATSAAATSFLDNCMCPYMSRMADDLLAEQVPVMSRGGLVLFRRRHASETRSYFCVHDLLTGDHTFLSCPPDVGSINTQNYVLLTSADGIGCPFMLFFTSLDGAKLKNDTRIVQVHTATSACPTWAPAAMVHESSGFFKNLRTAMNKGVAVLDGGVIHWLLPSRGEIATYNVCAMELGTITLPAHLVTNLKGGWSNLGSYYSSDGRKLLRLMVRKGFKMYVWHQLTDGEWAPEDAAIDMEETLRSLDPNISIQRIARTDQFQWCGEGSNIVLLCIRRRSSRRALLILLDLETKKMLAQQELSTSSMLLEIDLPSRLNRTFSDTYNYR